MKTTQGGLLIGWASEDITPTKRVELYGQFYPRVSTRVRDPLLATALVIESKGRGGRAEQAVMVSLDLVGADRELLERLRERVRGKLPDFDGTRLILNAIHTHNGPQVGAGHNWWTPDPGAVAPEEYRSVLLDRLERVVVSAWEARSPGGVSRALGRAAAGHCRRAVYADGTAEMYGRTDRPDFIGMEAGEDSGVDVLMCWDRRKKLTGLVLNFACPAQVMEATYCVTADFVGEARRQLPERLGRELFVLAQISAAGDQSPRDLTRNYRGEPDMWHESGAVEIGRRLTHAVADAYPAAESAVQTRPPLRHTVQTLHLPARGASEREYEEARRILREYEARELRKARPREAAFERFVADTRAREARGGPGPYDSKLHDFVIIRNNEAVVERYESQDRNPTVPVELHAIRLGDVAFATNPFELYLGYGQRIKARSRAQQTFLVQLACGRLGYLPTARAVSRGGYGALIANGSVGPDGGSILVEESVKAVNGLWRG